MNYEGEMKNIRRTYNREVRQLEFEILRSGDWADTVLFELRENRAYSIEHLVTEIEVAQYRDLKVEWIQDATNEPQINTFTEDRVNDYMNILLCLVKTQYKGDEYCCFSWVKRKTYSRVRSKLFRGRG